MLTESNTRIWGMPQPASYGDQLTTGHDPSLKWKKFNRFKNSNFSFDKYCHETISDTVLLDGLIELS